ncbi:MAG: sigma-70 family RNA polymerase sigma factor [Planctomycetales bacterium]|nr:sigma-70 family RNA polymerase sigma factor [Planctomycetales bacterium]
MLSEDRLTIEQVLSGDPTAFDQLVNKYQRRLLGLLAHACNDRSLAEDITQDAFVRAYQKLHLFSGDAQFYAWLARIAFNLLASSKRKKRIENQASREGYDVVLDTVGQSQQPFEELELSEVQQQVRLAVSELDEDRRAVVLLKDFDGMDYDTIAEMLEIPVGTVRSRLHRARLELKEILQRRVPDLRLGEI